MLLAALFLGAPRGLAQGNSDASLAQRRATRLRHGINLSEWFAQVYDQKGYVKEHFETWTTAQDIALIKAMGFDHVRLSVNPQPMFRRGQADQIPADYLGYLDMLEALFDFYYVQPALLAAKKAALNVKMQEAGKKPVR